MAWQNPKTDWVTNPKNPDETDFNRIEGNIAYLIDELDTKLPVGNADPSDVLQGKTFSRTGAIGLTGTMPDRGAVNHSLPINGTYTIPDGYHNGSGKVTQSIATKGAQTYTPGTANQTIAAGQYLTGAQTIKGDSNLKPENIRYGTEIFGQVGALSNIKSMQRGTVTVPEGSAWHYVDIEPVNPNASVARVILHSTANPPTDMFRILFSSESRIGLNRHYSGAAKDVTWEVIEFENVKSMQHGTVESYGPVTVTINPVDPFKSLIFVSRRSGSITNWGFSMINMSSVFNSSTSVTFYYELSNTILGWRIVEFY